MRELNECKAEIFWRSQVRINARRKKRNLILAWCVPLCLLIALWSVTSLPAGSNGAPSAEQHYGGGLAGNGGNCDGANGATSGNAGDYKGETSNSPGSVGGIDGATPNAPGSVPFGTVDSFSFSLTWGCYGTSSYDSETGKLVKTTDATNPEEYITTYQLTEGQKQQIYDLVKDLNVTTYPDTYNPHPDGLASSPSMTLILSVKTDSVQKTITAEGIALTFESENSQGQKFLSVCKAIRDILMETDEWKALPEYEFFYD